jgi:hypothetical protein
MKRKIWNCDFFIIKKPPLWARRALKPSAKHTVLGKAGITVIPAVLLQLENRVFNSV